jgi:hypothetical protein
MMGEIQDLLTSKDNDNLVMGALDFDEQTVIESDDIIILENEEALWQGIVGVLHTPKGKIDGVGLENYGSRLLTLRGMKLTYHIAELAKVFIEETIPQFQGKVNSFPRIDINIPSNLQNDNYGRFTMRIDITVDSIYGLFHRTLYI